MKNTLKLSNYLFNWFFRKYERHILWITLTISVILILSVGDLYSNNKYEHFGVEFRTYDLVVDYSGVGFVFILGLIALLLLLFIQINGFYTNGKGMYSIYTLPMKRNEVFFAFFLSAATAVMLYFAAWLIAMVILYFPITGMYEKAASEAVLYISEEVTVSNLDVSITNGLFLAFQRSSFLSSCFPVSGLQALALGGGMFLSIIAVVFAGLYNEDISQRVLLLLTVLLGFLGAFYRVWIIIKKSYYLANEFILQSLSFSAIAIVVGFALLFTALYKLKRRKDI